MNATTQENKNLQQLRDSEHTHLTRLFGHWRRHHNILCTDLAKARVGQVIGFISAAVDFGQLELANQLADSFLGQIQRLAHPDNTYKHLVHKETDGTEITCQLPHHKCILHDDGTRNGFSFTMFRLMNPEVFEEKFQEQLQEQLHSQSGTSDPCQAAIQALQIRTHVNPYDRYSEELTEYRFAGGQHLKFYYVPAYPGGLLYHGPGGGEVMAITLESAPVFWSIHT